MATFIGTNGGDVANADNGTLIGFTGGTLAQLQDGDGDTYEGDQGGDTVVAGSGDDLIWGQAGDDLLDGNDGNDTLEGGDSTDTVRGGLGNDIIRIGAGDLAFGDSMNGGADTDTLEITADGVYIFEILFIQNIEALRFAHTSGSVTARFDETQIGGSAITQIEGSAGVEAIDVSGSAVDLSALTFANWTDGTDTITITGTGTLTGSSRNDSISLSTNTSGTLNGGGGHDTLTGDSSSDTLSGGTGDDWLRGGGGGDSIEGNENDDLLEGEGGDDILNGGFRNDTLDGGAGYNALNGGPGDDVLIIGDNYSNGSFDGGDGIDTLSVLMQGDTSIGFAVFSNIEILEFGGAAGTNVSVQMQPEQFGAGKITEARGGDSANALTVSSLGAAGYAINLAAITFTNWQDGSDSVRILGNIFNDTLTGSATPDTIEGYDGTDYITGGAGADALYGGPGDDLFDYSDITGSTGNEIIDGGDGTSDVIKVISGSIDFSLAQIIGIEVLALVAANGGGTSVQFDGSQIGAAPGLLITSIAATSLLPGHTIKASGVLVDLSNLSFTNWDSNDLCEITGTAGNDFHYGSTQGDLINGAAGNDQMDGEGGNDTLNGGAGADTLDGGTGVDTADYSAAATTAILHLDGATPYGQYGSGAGGAAETDLLISIENLTGGSAGDYLYGDALANELRGNAGNDVFAAGSGNDTIDGGSEADFIDASSDDDSVLGGTGGDTVYGGDGNDTVLGGDEQDFIYGDQGADSLDGGNGVDVLFADSTDLYYDGGAGTDYIVWQDVNVAANLDITAHSADYFYGYTGADVVTAAGATARPELHGADGNDTLSGTAGLGSILLGENGDDRLIGSTGVDHFVGGAGADTFAVTLNGGTDFVYDFAPGADKAEFSIAAAANFAALTVITAYGATGWWGYQYATGTLWLNTAALANAQPAAGDFLFV